MKLLHAKEIQSALVLTFSSRGHCKEVVQMIAMR